MYIYIYIYVVYIIVSIRPHHLFYVHLRYPFKKTEQQGMMLTYRTLTRMSKCKDSIHVDSSMFAMKTRATLQGSSAGLWGCVSPVMSSSPMICLVMYYYT